MKSLKKILCITLLISVTTIWTVTAAFAGQVMTVLGPISSDDLGVTLMHEHMAFHWPGSEADRSVAPYDRDALEKKILPVLEDVKAVGVKTIIDAGMCDTGGRDPILLKNLAEKDRYPGPSWMDDKELRSLLNAVPSDVHFVGQFSFFRLFQEIFSIVPSLGMAKGFMPKHMYGALGYGRIEEDGIFLGSVWGMGELAEFSRKFMLFFPMFKQGLEAAGSSPFMDI